MHFKSRAGAIILIVLGSIFLLSNFGMLPRLGPLIAQWWPLIPTSLACRCWCADEADFARCPRGCRRSQAASAQVDRPVRILVGSRPALWPTSPRPRAERMQPELKQTVVVTTARAGGRRRDATRRPMAARWLAPIVAGAGAAGVQRLYDR
jgi:hypothetical protein